VEIFISQAEAETLAGGEVLFSDLYIISPESDVFPLDPFPENPCWAVRTERNGIIEIEVIDAISGRDLGQGIAPPYTAFSFSGPQYEDPCSGAWSGWYTNAKNWFISMGYDCQGASWPVENTLKNHIQNNTTGMFYELCHGGSSSFAYGCSGGSYYDMITAGTIGNWLEEYYPMRFTFVGSCGGMCSTGPYSFAYEFRKGIDENTAVVGYCGMGDEWCSSCWIFSISWQSALFDYMSQGWTVKAAFDQAQADYPVCAGTNNCMRFEGDEEFAGPYYRPGPDYVCIDSDEDGYGDPGYPQNDCPDDNCPTVFNPAQEDSDQDNVGDSCDICPFDPEDDCCNPVVGNSPPQISSPKLVSVAPGETFEYTAAAYDYDCDGTDLSYYFFDFPFWCNVQSGTISGRAECDYADTTFGVIASDGDLFDTLIVSLLIDISNQPPQILDSAETVFVRCSRVFNYYPSILDPDDTVHLITYPHIPAWCALQNDTVAGIAPDSIVVETLTVAARDYCNADTVSFMVAVYICGDANRDSEINVSDAVHIINYIFAGGDSPVPDEAGDVNCDEIVNVSDAVWIINYVFVGGNIPCDTDGDGIGDC
jgi:hypothetical protein